MPASREYEVVLVREEDGGFSVTAPALPGCTSQGETRDEAVVMIYEAIGLYIESLVANGDPIPGASQERARHGEGTAQGLTMTLVPRGQQLTTQQAADILRVSQPYLVLLLEKGEIPYHKVGTHRRLNIDDVLDYRAKRAEKRRRALSELTELSEDVGYR